MDQWSGSKWVFLEPTVLISGVYIGETKSLVGGFNLVEKY